jgi:hypothetical protein
MGMFLTNYEVLRTIGYGGDFSTSKELAKVLARFKLFGVILHDPKHHVEFDQVLEVIFPRIDFLTGKEFLFFALTKPSKEWCDRNSSRDYYQILNGNDSLIPLDGINGRDPSITAFTIADGLGIDYNDLPAIVLATDLGSNKFHVVKTCAAHLELQMTEIGVLTSEKVKIDSLDDPDLLSLIKEIDLCGGSFNMSSDEGIAKIMSDFLSFINQSTSHGAVAELAKKQMIDYAVRYHQTKDFIRDPIKLDKLNQFFLGCLSNLRDANRDATFKIDDRCEDKSRIIFQTYNMVAPLFESLSIAPLLDGGPNSNSTTGALGWHMNNHDVDYYPLIGSLCKIFEIEVNLSLVQWFRRALEIEMPRYYKKYYHDKSKSYTVTPIIKGSENPRPIDLNRGQGEIWFAPGIGESELVMKKFLNQKNVPDEIKDYDVLLENWSTLRRYRNMGAHTETIGKKEFEAVQTAFSNLISTNLLSQMNDIKVTLRG